jgi:hypothetical protein
MKAGTSIHTNSPILEIPLYPVIGRVRYPEISKVSMLIKLGADPNLKFDAYILYRKASLISHGSRSIRSVVL